MITKIETGFINDDFVLNRVTAKIYWYDDPKTYLPIKIDSDYRMTLLQNGNTLGSSHAEEVMKFFREHPEQAPFPL